MGVGRILTAANTVLCPGSTFLIVTLPQHELFFRYIVSSLNSLSVSPSATSSIANINLIMTTYMYM